MKFGHFDDQAKEYVITTPHTPLPWINYLGSENFFGLISNTGGGYSFYRDAKLQRLLRFRYNEVGGDIGGRFTYIKEKGEKAWSPAFLPCKTELDSYKCHHGLGYTVFESSKNKISATSTHFVPMGENCEIQRITLTNNSNETKELSLYGAVEWCLWNAVDDSTNFQRNLNIAEVEIEDNVIYHKTEYRERRDHYAFFGSNVKADGYDTDRNTFIGQFNTWENPSLVTQRKSGNSEAHGWYPIACQRFDITLKPEESRTIIFVIGYGQNPVEKKFIKPGIIRKDTAIRIMDKFKTEKAVSNELKKIALHWESLLSKYQVSSDDEKMNRMVNIWNQYQCMVTFNMSRSASYFETGTGRGMGFRDSCQDILGFVHLIPTRARERIIDIASIQNEDGSTSHQYQPLTKRGNDEIGSGFNDDPLWLIAAVGAYIRETGDYSILDEPTPFKNEKGSEKPLFEHLRASIHFTMKNRGPHGLPLIGRADWNDCLNLNCFSETPGESFQTVQNYDSGKAESVFIAGMFVKYGKEYAEIARRRGEQEEATKVEQAVSEITKATMTAGWDGEWFLRAYDAFEHKVGSNECSEGKIYIEPQGFCSLAGIGKDEGFIEKSMDSVRKHLLGEYGVELLSPCYTTYHKELGEISSYPPGYKENGSIFCHNNPWISIGETVIGRGANAWDIYKRICPAYLEDQSEIHQTEPYVYSQTIAARSSFANGSAKNSWLTGTAAWTFVNISQAILGIKPDFDGLRIEPCIPPTLKQFSIIREYRGSIYNIHVVNKTQNTNEPSQPQLKVDGKSVKGTLIPCSTTKKTCTVEVEV
ncbi:MAG: glycosyl transferase [Treponema sp. CETP13]|nr:MAG: glycosyl transferase [Treponema sp. CETP13]